MHRDANRARLVGDRAGDRLTDPPRRIGREFVAAAVFEFIDRLHQADIAFLDQIEELQPAIGVFLGNRDDEPEIGLDHLLFGAAGLALAALDGLHDAAEFGDRQFRLAGDLRNRGAVARNIVEMLLDELRPAAAWAFAGPFQPIARQFVAHVMLQEVGALDAGGLGQPQQPALFGDKAAVQLVELLDEVLDAGVVEFDLAQGLDNLVLQLVVAALGGARQLGRLNDRGDALVLDLGELFVAIGDAIENRHHAGPQLGFHRGERGASFLAVFFAVAFALFAQLDDDIVARRSGAIRVADRLGGLYDRGAGLIKIGGAVGRVQIDDIAQQHVVFVQRVAAPDPPKPGQRARADAPDHTI